MILNEDLKKEKLIILSELRKRLPWMIGLRWWVPGTIAVGSLTAWTVGIHFAVKQILAIGAFILFYNIVFAVYNIFLASEPSGNEKRIESFACWQVRLDLLMVFILVYYTGGPASPFIFFFIFHIIFASMLLKPRSAWGLAGAVSVCMAVLSIIHALGWIHDRHLISFHGWSFDIALNAFPLFVEILFFCASIFITAYITTAIMGVVRRRIIKLAEMSESVMVLNERLQSLYSMSKSIVSTLDIDQVLDIVSSELVKVMDVKGITVKLLSEDSRFLRYAAVKGLPYENLKERVVDVERSPLNKRIIEGETFVTGFITEPTDYQFGEDLTASGIQSIQFVPLKTEDRVTGILGAYSERPEKFDSNDVDFFRLAADLVAIALENARAYKAVEDLMKERAWYMTRVAHNLRAPLAAMISILDVVLGGYVGEINPEQKEYMQRIDKRARTAVKMINQLMILAKSRSARNAKAEVLVDVASLAKRLFNVFQNEAAKKDLRYEMKTSDRLPMIKADPEMIEQLIENLLSNAIKYTLKEGKVELRIERTDEGSLLIEAADTGIGIPDEDKPKLFTEYFRAKNARLTEEIGTGLGLSIIKEIVEQNSGTLRLESQLGQGTTISVVFPSGE